jgi:hypothetical protein
LREKAHDNTKREREREREGVVLKEREGGVLDDGVFGFWILFFSLSFICNEGNL